MSQHRDWSKVQRAFQEGNVEALQKVKNGLNTNGNHLVTIDWELTYASKDHYVNSNYTITPKNKGSMITCVLNLFTVNDAYISANIASQIAPVLTTGNGAFYGLSSLSYKTQKEEVIIAEVIGTVTDSNQKDVSFKFVKEIIVF